MATAMLATAGGTPRTWRRGRGEGIGGMDAQRQAVRMLVLRARVREAGLVWCFAVWAWVYRTAPRRAFQKKAKRDSWPLIGPESGTPDFHEAPILGAPMTRQLPPPYRTTTFTHHRHASHPPMTARSSSPVTPSVQLPPLLHCSELRFLASLTPTVSPPIAPLHSPARS